MLRLSFILIAIAGCFGLKAQEAFQTFKDRRVINAHSVEMLAQKKLDVRITHRFGNLAGEDGGFKTFFGLENVADVLIGAEYGVLNNLNIGLYRSKGAGSSPSGSSGLRQLTSGFVKYRVLQQVDQDGSPITLTVLGVASVSTSPKSENPSSINNFPNFTDRMAFTVQAIVGKKFSDGFSLQLNGGYTHRNIVAFDDVNGVVSVGIASRVQLSKIFGIIADITLPFSENRTNLNGYYPSIGVGLEIDSGGHIFQVNLTNSKGLIETDYIPYSTSNWGDSEFRLGFTISRIFNL
jgi:hypothetical protein